MKISDKGHYEIIVAWLSRKSAAIGGTLIPAMVLVIVVDLSGRFLFDTPLVGATELNRTLLVVLVFFGLAFTQLKNGHICMDFLVSRVSGKVSLILDVFSLVSALLVYVFATYATIPVTISSIQRGEYETGLIAFPMWPARLFMSIGLLLFVLQLSADIKKKITARETFDSSRESTSEKKH